MIVYELGYNHGIDKWKAREAWGALVVKTCALNLVSQGSSPTSVRAFFSLSLCLTLMPWSSLSSTPSNEEVFHRILRRGCKAVSPGGPGLISLKLFQTLISHYYSGKRKGNIKKKIKGMIIIG